MAPVLVNLVYLYIFQMLPISFQYAILVSTAQNFFRPMILCENYDSVGGKYFIFFGFSFELSCYLESNKRRVW